MYQQTHLQRNALNGIDTAVKVAQVDCLAQISVQSVAVVLAEIHILQSSASIEAVLRYDHAVVLKVAVLQLI